MNTLLKASILLSSAVIAKGHGYLTNPLPRQYRDGGIPGIGWTKWMGITIPGDASFNPGEGNAPNLNAGIGGGYAGMERELSEGHGLCGDIGSRRGFTDGPYGATEARGFPYSAGGAIDVSVKLTAYHAGWFEFRLCNLDSAGYLTQDCLNENVLEIDESTPYYPAILDYAGMHGISSMGDGGHYKCANTGGHTDSTSNTPNEVWPVGSCCNGGGACSPPMQNIDRYVVERVEGGGVRDYDIVLKLPENIECEHCVLQWFYQTANSRETYPESFWNCADIAINGNGSPGSPTTNSPARTSSPEAPVITTTATAISEPVNSGCGSCSGCWWTVVSSTQGCYTDWSKSTCSAQVDAYVWCGSSSPVTPTSPPITDAPPTSITADPTTSPSTPSEGSCVDINNGCQSNWCSDAYWRSQCLATCGACD